MGAAAIRGRNPWSQTGGRGPPPTTAKKGREEARKAREGQTPEGESPIVENNRESEMLRRDSKPDEANRLHRGCKKNKERGGVKS